MSGPRLAFPEHAGCAGIRDGHDDTLHPCMSPPVGTVKHRSADRRPHTIRLFVCEAHAIGHPDPRPLSETDRAELRRRRRGMLAGRPAR